MGKKSTVNRLPKEERTHPTSKITVRPSPRMQDPMEVEALPHQPETPDTPIPTLDNESLNKILHLAGTATVLRARSVNRQWRRVATDILNNVHYIQLSRLFPNIPTSTLVHSTLNVFAKLEGVSIRDWPYTHVYPCIADEIAVVNLPCLKEVELMGVHITPAAMGQLVRKETVRFLTLGNHDSVNRAVVSAMVKARERLYESRYLLDRLVFKRARCLEGHEITTASKAFIAQEIEVISCPNIRQTQLSCISLSSARTQRTYETYALTNCRNLTDVIVKLAISSNDCTHLNLSQCTSLAQLTFIVENPELQDMGTILKSDLTSLNLSGCRELRDISIDMNGPVSVMFPRIETLILFGTRRLSRSCIQEVFALDRTVPLLISLIRLDLNGTTIDKLILNNYPQLQWVDVSGCPYLVSIDVRECWRLQSFSINGKRAPLTSVSLILPATCKLAGRRDSWHWQLQGSHQAISYP